MRAIERQHIFHLSDRVDPGFDNPSFVKNDGEIGTLIQWQDSSLGFLWRASCQCLSGLQTCISLHPASHFWEFIIWIYWHTYEMVYVQSSSLQYFSQWQKIGKPSTCPSTWNWLDQLQHSDTIERQAILYCGKKEKSVYIGMEILKNLW